MRKRWSTPALRASCATTARPSTAGVTDITAATRCVLGGDANDMTAGIGDPPQHDAFGIDPGSRRAAAMAA